MKDFKLVDPSETFQLGQKMTNRALTSEGLIISKESFLSVGDRVDCDTSSQMSYDCQVDLYKELIFSVKHDSLINENNQ